MHKQQEVVCIKRRTRDKIMNYWNGTDHQSSNENIDINGYPQTELDIVVVSATVSLFIMFYFCLPSKTNYCN